MSTSVSTNRLDLTTTGTQYDAAGNVTYWIAGGYGYTATYTHLGMMASLVGNHANSLFAYDADGERTLVRDRLASVYTISLRDVSGHDIRELTYTPSTRPGRGRRTRSTEEGHCWRRWGRRKASGSTTSTISARRGW